MKKYLYYTLKSTGKSIELAVCPTIEKWDKEAMYDDKRY